MQDNPWEMFSAILFFQNNEILQSTLDFLKNNPDLKDELGNELADLSGQIDDCLLRVEGTEKSQKDLCEKLEMMQKKMEKLELTPRPSPGIGFILKITFHM